jgi:hypothetical protein
VQKKIHIFLRVTAVENAKLIVVPMDATEAKL